VKVCEADPWPSHLAGPQPPPFPQLGPANCKYITKTITTWTLLYNPYNHDSVSSWAADSYPAGQQFPHTFREFGALIHTLSPFQCYPPLYTYASQVTSSLHVSYTKFCIHFHFSHTFYMPIHLILFYLIVFTILGTGYKF
jgi:hypothetical protein